MTGTPQDPGPADASTSAEDLLRRLETFLRRPGEVFAEEWEGYRPRHDGPCISTTWAMAPRDDAPNEVWEWEDEFSRAWDQVCDDTVFLRWWDDNRSALCADDMDNELTVDDGVAETLRFSRTGNLAMRVAIETIREAREPREELRRIILAMLAKRAAREGITPPPAD